MQIRTEIENIFPCMVKVHGVVLIEKAVSINVFFGVCYHMTHMINNSDFAMALNLKLTVPLPDKHRANFQLSW